MSSLRVIGKRRSKKKQQKETEKQHHVVVTENNLFKDFTTKGVRNYDQKLSDQLDGAAYLPARNLPQREEFHAATLSSLPDYF